MKHSGLGFTVGKHGLGHGGTDPVAGKQDTIHNFYAELIRQRCDRLAAAPEGDGTVLDDTAVVWFNENGTSHHSRPRDPYLGVVIGGSSRRSDPRPVPPHFQQAEPAPVSPPCRARPMKKSEAIFMGGA